MTDKNLIFISYAHEDESLAYEVYDDLKYLGLSPWLDKKSLLGGQSWRTEIKKAIKNCSFFLALLSSKSITKRGYVQKEVKEAIPSDILDKLRVGNSVRYAESLLGVPIQEWDNFLKYNTSDVIVIIEKSKDGKSIESVKIAPTNKNTIKQYNKTIHVRWLLESGN